MNQNDDELTTICEKCGVRYYHPSATHENYHGVIYKKNNDDYFSCQVQNCPTKLNKNYTAEWIFNHIKMHNYFQDYDDERDKDIKCKYCYSFPESSTHIGYHIMPHNVQRTKDKWFDTNYFKEQSGNPQQYAVILRKPGVQETVIRTKNLSETKSFKDKNREMKKLQLEKEKERGGAYDIILELLNIEKEENELKEKEKMKIARKEEKNRLWREKSIKEERERRKQEYADAMKILPELQLKREKLINELEINNIENRIKYYNYVIEREEKERERERERDEYIPTLFPTSEFIPLLEPTSEFIPLLEPTSGPTNESVGAPGFNPPVSSTNRLKRLAIEENTSESKRLKRTPEHTSIILPEKIDIVQAEKIKQNGIIIQEIGAVFEMIIDDYDNTTDLDDFINKYLNPNRKHTLKNYDIYIDSIKDNLPNTLKLIKLPPKIKDIKNDILKINNKKPDKETLRKLLNEILKNYSKETYVDIRIKPKKETPKIEESPIIKCSECGTTENIVIKNYLYDEKSLCKDCIYKKKVDIEDNEYVFEKYNKIKIGDKVNYNQRLVDYSNGINYWKSDYEYDTGIVKDKKYVTNKKNNITNYYVLVEKNFGDPSWVKIEEIYTENLYNWKNDYPDLTNPYDRKPRVDGKVKSVRRSKKSKRKSKRNSKRNSKRKSKRNSKRKSKRNFS